MGASLVRSPCCQLVVAMSESTKRGRSPNANKHKQPPSALMGRSTHKCIAKTCQRSEKLCIGSGFLLKAYDRSCCASVSSWSGSITSSTLISLNSSSLSNSSDACFFFRYGRLCSRHSPVGFQSYLRTGGEPNHHWQSISAVENDAILIEPRRRRTVQVGAGKAGTQTNLRFLTKFQNLSSISS